MGEVPRGTGRCCVTTSRESPSPPSGVSPGVEVSSVSPASCTRKQGESSRCSSRTSGGRPSLPWTSSTPSRGREGPSTDSVDKCLSAPCPDNLKPAERTPDHLKPHFPPRGGRRPRQNKKKQPSYPQTGVLFNTTYERKSLSTPSRGSCPLVHTHPTPFPLYHKSKSSAHADAALRQNAQVREMEGAALLVKSKFNKTNPLK